MLRRSRRRTIATIQTLMRGPRLLPVYAQPAVLRAPQASPVRTAIVSAPLPVVEVTTVRMEQLQATIPILHVRSILPVQELEASRCTTMQLKYQTISM